MWCPRSPPRRDRSHSNILLISSLFGERAPTNSLHLIAPREHRSFLFGHLFSFGLQGDLVYGKSFFRILPTSWGNLHSFLFFSASSFSAGPWGTPVSKGNLFHSLTTLSLVLGGKGKSFLFFFLKLYNKQKGRGRRLFFTGPQFLYRGKGDGLSDTGPPQRGLGAPTGGDKPFSRMGFC